MQQPVCDEPLYQNGQALNEGSCPLSFKVQASCGANWMLANTTLLPPFSRAPAKARSALHQLFNHPGCVREAGHPMHTVKGICWPLNGTMC